MKYRTDDEPGRIAFEMLVHGLSDNHLEQAIVRDKLAKLQEREDAILEGLKDLGRDPSMELAYFMNVLREKRK
jgi:hypothetical protein